MADKTPAETEQQSLRAEVVDKVAALATAAFGLVAALAWNSAIQAIFQQYAPAGGVIWGLIVYALVVTIVAVVVTVWIGRVAGRLRGERNRERAG